MSIAPGALHQRPSDPASGTEIRHQFRRSEQTRQRDRVAPVGLHAIARARRHKRGRDHIADMAEGSDAPVKPIPGWAGLIADVQGLVLARQLTQEPLNGSRRGLDLAEIAHLPLPAALRDGHGGLLLDRIRRKLRYGGPWFVLLGMRLGSACPSNPRQLMHAKVRASRPFRTTDIPSRPTRGLRQRRVASCSTARESERRLLLPPRIRVAVNSGSRIGTIKYLEIEKVSGQVVYAITSFSSFLAVWADTHKIPWSKLTYDPQLHGFRTDITEGQLRNAPTFSRGEEFDWTEEERERLHRHWDSPRRWKWTPCAGPRHAVS